MNAVESKFYEQRAEEFKETAMANEILRVRVGSHLHGTNTPTSDIDYVTIWVPTREQTLGLVKPKQEHFELEENGTKIEINSYPIGKFVDDMLKNNPTHLEILYANEDNVVHATRAGQKLMESVNLFLEDKQCLDRFIGYAMSQRKKLTFKLERMQGFMQAVQQLNKLKKEGHDTLPERLEIEASNEDGYWRIYEKGTPIDKVLANATDKLAEYGWRKELVQKHGFDTKFAANLVRLMAEGFDLFTHGKITFPLRIKDSIREIREGKWTLSQVLEAGEVWEKRVNEAYERNPLPKMADLYGVEKLMLEIYEEVWSCS